MHRVCLKYMEMQSLYFDPYDVNDLVEKIKSAITNDNLKKRFN